MADNERKSFFKRLRTGLTKARQGLTDRVKSILHKGGKIDESLFEDLEEALIQADAGIETSLALIDDLRHRVKEAKITDAADVQPLLEQSMEDMLRAEPLITTAKSGPLTYVVVGVNGAGKTTTIGKLAARFQNEGKSVILGAGDTFRAAAIDQLSVWTERSGAQLIAQQSGSDPAAVAFDAVHAAVARNADVLLIDTAGRLQTKTNLMQELNKVYRVIERELGRQPDEVLLVVDATTGQNALSQGRLFQEAVPLSGLVLTKMDGTAKGGIVLSVSSELDIPVKLIGIGEGVDDLRDFDPETFVQALLRSDEEDASS